MKKKFQDPAVEAVFSSYPKKLRAPLLEVRALIFDIASQTDGVGPIVETLRWNEPSYLTEETGSGSMVRVAPFGDDKIAVFFHCQTTLVDSFRGLFPELEYSKNRAIVLDPTKALPIGELGICIEMSLTYKLMKKRKKIN